MVIINLCQCSNVPNRRHIIGSNPVHECDDQADSQCHSCTTLNKPSGSSQRSKPRSCWAGGVTHTRTGSRSSGSNGSTAGETGLRRVATMNHSPFTSRECVIKSPENEGRFCTSRQGSRRPFRHRGKTLKRINHPNYDDWIHTQSQIK